MVEIESPNKSELRREIEQLEREYEGTYTTPMELMKGGGAALTIIVALAFGLGGAVNIGIALSQELLGGAVVGLVGISFFVYAVYVIYNSVRKTRIQSKISRLKSQLEPANNNVGR